MNRGSILHYVIGSHQLRVVLVTADRYNPAHGLIAPLRERSAPDFMPTFLVPLTRDDWPSDAVIDLTRLRRSDPAAIVAHAATLSRDSLHNLTMAIRTYFGAAD